jgi:hypothetical protein
MAGEPATHPGEPAAAGKREHEPAAVRQLVEPAGVRVAAVFAYRVDPVGAVIGQRVGVSGEQAPPQRTGRRSDDLHFAG